MAITIRPATNQRNIAPGVENSQVRLNPVGLEAGARSIGQLAGGLQRLNLTYMQREEDNDTSRLLTANNEVDRRLNVLRNDMLEKRRLGNAEGVTMDFAAEARKIQEEVYANSGIKYRKTQERFEIQTERQLIANEAQMQGYERSQVRENLNIQTDNALTSAVNAGIASGNPADFDNCIQTGRDILRDAYLNSDGQDYVDALERKFVTGSVKSTVADSLFNKRDYVGASAVIDRYKGDIDRAELLRLEKMVGEYKRADSQQSIITQALALYSNDPAKAKEYYDSRMGESSQGDYPVGNYVTKAGVNVDNLQAGTKAGMGVLAGLYRRMFGEDMLITSGNDSAVHAGAEGVRGSHYSGDKIDIANDALEQNPEKRRRFIADAAKLGIVIADEYEKPSANSTGGHLDVNFMDYKPPQRRVPALEKADNDRAFYAAVAQREEQERALITGAKTDYMRKAFTMRRQANGALDPRSLLDLKYRTLENYGFAPDSKQYIDMDMALSQTYGQMTAAPKDSVPEVYRSLRVLQALGTLTLNAVEKAYGAGWLSDSNADSLAAAAAQIQEKKDDAETKAYTDRAVREIEKLLPNKDKREDFLSDMAILTQEMPVRDKYDYMIASAEKQAKAPGVFRRYTPRGIETLKKTKTLFGNAAEATMASVEMALNAPVTADGVPVTRRKATEAEVVSELNTIASILIKADQAGDSLYREIYRQKVNSGQGISAAMLIKLHDDILIQRSASVEAPALYFDSNYTAQGAGTESAGLIISD